LWVSVEGDDGRNYGVSDTIWSEEVWMKATITGPFPTVKDTAEVLGVSATRLTELMRLTGSGSPFRAKKSVWALSLEESRNKGSRTKSKTGAKQRSTSASRKRRARGKTAKVLA
jgi:hypothetical protein